MFTSLSLALQFVDFVLSNLIGTLMLGLTVFIAVLMFIDHRRKKPKPPAPVEVIVPKPRTWEDRCRDWDRGDDF